MKKLYTLLITLMTISFAFGQDLIITGVFDGPLSGGTPKAIELYVINDIADLSIYGMGSANNGGGTDGQEFTFPADAATAGDFIYLTYEGSNPGSFNTYFGFEADYIDGFAGINGDDAVELFMNSAVIDTFGDISTDGSGTAWDYLDGWAYRNDNTGPDGASFIIANWTFSGINVNDGQSDNASATTPFPLGTFSYVPSSDPSLAITNPTDGTEYNPETTSLDVTFVVQNFTVATAGNGDGHIHYAIDGGSTVMKFDTDPIPLTGLTGGAHSVYMELVDDAHQPLDPPVNQTVNFTIASYTDVANLAEFRAGTVGQYYRITGEIYGTYAQSYRNQKWAQDATAGIMIDDNEGVITTTYTEGDGITNVKGQLNDYYGLKQLIPTVDPGAPSSTGNIITPEVISITEFTSNGQNYESELIQIGEAVTFADGDGTNMFATGTAYEVSGATDTCSMRTAFYDADYIGTVIPNSPVSLTGIVTLSYSVYYITPRDLASGIVLGIDQQPIEGFGLYPNPVNNGILSIITQNNLEKNIQIFNVLGKQVFAQTTSSSTINISTLNSGIYIVRVEEAGRLATRKLVIE